MSTKINMNLLSLDSLPFPGLTGYDCTRNIPTDIFRYAAHDTLETLMAWRDLQLKIKKVIFNDPATIVFWMDNTKTVVKAENEDFDPEKGLAMAIAKKAFGNKGNYFNEIKKWTNQYYEHNEEGDKTK